MASRLGLLLLLSAADASGAVLPLPARVAAPAGFAAAGAVLSPALSPVSGLAPAAPAPLPLVPTSALSPAPVFAAAPAIAERAPAPAGRVRLIRDFGSRILGNRRDVAVYLPPGYEEGARRYPVLYVQDGQNVFDPATAFGGVDWGLARTCDRLIAAGEMEPVIIVAPYNTAARTREYTPVSDAGYGGGEGDAYGRFLSDELKPFVDARLRTRPDAGSTAIMGSSLGGLISLHLAFTRPDVFSRAAALSPSLWWSEGRMARWTRRSPLPEPRPRLWVDMGTKEGDEPADHEANLQNLRAFNEALRARGWRMGGDLESHEIAGAAHHESAWAARAAWVLKFLFPPSSAPR